MSTSYIANAINSLLDRLASIPFDWNSYISTKSNGAITTTVMPDTTKLFQNLAVWNNQPRQWLSGKGFPEGKPCCYVEFVFGDGMRLGGAVTLYPDFIFKIHIIDWQIDGFNEGGGTGGTNELIGGLDQNLEILQWRDLVKTYCEVFFPVSCGALTTWKEYPDVNHQEIYHYVIEFKTAFTDLKGGVLDADQILVTPVDPPEPAGQFGFNPTINITS